MNLTKELKKGSASGFVNGILRTVARSGKEIFENLRISEKISIPAAIFQALRKDYSTEDIVKMGEWFLSPESKRLTVRRNQSKCTEEELRDVLASDGAELLPVLLPESKEASSDVYELRSQKRIHQLKAFQNGLFYVQDISSSLAGDAISDLLTSQGTEMAVLDVSASPGGKSLHLTDMALKQGISAEITACDISEERLKPLRENISHYGVSNIHPFVQDGTVFNKDFEEHFDLVLCDVPCSGLGCLSGKPDIRLRTSGESLAEIAVLQSKILDNASRYVKAGGTLLYSTCTVNKAENEHQISAFLSSHPEFTSVLEKAYLPGLNTTGDGFYIHRLRKSE